MLLLWTFSYHSSEQMSLNTLMSTNETSITYFKNHSPCSDIDFKRFIMLYGEIKESTMSWFWTLVGLMLLLLTCLHIGYFYWLCLWCYFHSNQRNSGNSAVHDIPLHYLATCNFCDVINWCTLVTKYSRHYWQFLHSELCFLCTCHCKSV